jgi:hypothetical protein
MVDVVAEVSAEDGIAHGLRGERYRVAAEVDCVHVCHLIESARRRWEIEREEGRT